MSKQEGVITQSTPEGRKRRTDLLQYYDVPSESSADLPPPALNLMNSQFDAKLYAQNRIKNCSLKQLLEDEVSLSTAAHRLDSDCQTLVYEHYDKFLHATDLVQKDHRGELKQLLGAHNMLQKLEFLFRLPLIVDKSIADGKMEEAVESYLSTKEVLECYKDMGSLAAVRSDCDQALLRMKAALHHSIRQGSPRELATSVQLLLRLGEQRSVLQDSFLSSAHHKLQSHLLELNVLAKPTTRLCNNMTEKSEATSVAIDDSSTDAVQHTDTDGRISSEKKQHFSTDLLLFIDRCHDTYVADLWLLISCYQEMFLTNINLKDELMVGLEKLYERVDEWVKELLQVVRQRLKEEVPLLPLQCRVMATALDKLHRRLRALETLLQRSVYTQWSLELIYDAAELQCQQSLTALKLSLENTLADVRQGVASSSTGGQTELPNLLSHLVATTAANIKQHISSLAILLTSGFTFSQEEDWRRLVAVGGVREGVVVAFLLHLTHTLAAFSGSPLDAADCLGGAVSSAALLLVLARAAWDLHTSTAHYLLRECDDALSVTALQQTTPLHTTASSDITSLLRTAAHRLLDAYVFKQGATMAQLVMRSVELKDWLGGGEPYAVRRVVKTIKEDIEVIEAQVSCLYEEGTRKERSSDSSRRTYHSLSTGLAPRSTGTGGGSWSHSGRLNSSLRLSRLWSDRIEIYGPVQPNTLSITTAILKIALKSLEESVRLRTFGRFGLQQLQVDVYYLRVHLWRHFTDDSLLNALLDAVLTAGALRCAHPELMEQNVVEFICDQ